MISFFVFFFFKETINKFLEMTFVLFLKFGLDT